MLFRSTENISESVPRPSSIKIEYLDELFEPKSEEYTGYYARIIQHEYDHIEGTMFIDRISPLRKQLIKSKLANIVKRKITCRYKFK